MAAGSAATGQVVVISGPSGVGKSTIVSRLLARCPLPLTLSVSATTRARRKGETEGQQYYFLSDEEFARRREAGEFLECFEVFGRGHWYGTLRKTVSTGLSEGKWVILEIDVDGAMATLEHFPDAVTIFIRPESWEILEQRLRGRGTETDEKIRRRLEVARRELTFAPRYEHQVVNVDIDTTVEQICDILRQRRNQQRGE